MHPWSVAVTGTSQLLSGGKSHLRCHHSFFCTHPSPCTAVCMVSNFKSSRKTSKREKMVVRCLMKHEEYRDTPVGGALAVLYSSRLRTGRRSSLLNVRKVFSLFSFLTGSSFKTMQNWPQLLKLETRYLTHAHGRGNLGHFMVMCVKQKMIGIFP